MGYDVKIVFYNDERAMQRGIKKEAKKGWEVASTEVVSEGYAAGKTCCLGCLFFPLALLGRKGNRYKVQYRKEVA